MRYAKPREDVAITAVHLQFQPFTSDGQTPRSGPARRGKPIEVRNGLPEFRPYRYAGMGESMSENEAEWWLKNGIQAGLQRTGRPGGFQ